MTDILWPAELVEDYLGYWNGMTYSDPEQLVKQLYIGGDMTFLEFDLLTDALILQRGMSEVTCPRCSATRKGLRVNDEIVALHCDECGFSGYVDG